MNKEGKKRLGKSGRGSLRGSDLKIIPLLGGFLSAEKKKEGNKILPEVGERKGSASSRVSVRGGSVKVKGGAELKMMRYG